MLNKFVPTLFGFFFVLIFIILSITLLCADGQAGAKPVKAVKQHSVLNEPDIQKSQRIKPAKPLFEEGKPAGFANPALNLAVLVFIGIVLLAVALAIKVAFITLIFSFVRSGFHAKLNPFTASRRRRQ